MKFAIRRAALAAIVIVSAIAASTPAAARDAQSTGSVVYWGAYIDGVPWDMSRLDAFELNSQKRVSIVHWGQPWMMSGAYQAFQAEEYDKVRARGSIPMVSWGSWHLGRGVDQPDFQLRDVYEGRHDAYIRQWATEAKAWGHPFFLRFDHEMNGWWQFPWSEQRNGNQPGDYVKAWRHVHDIFTQVGAMNVTWVWCPNIVSASTTPLPSVYPGDAYVDWVAMDGYNWGSDRGNVWQGFHSVFQQTYDEMIALAPAKPIMIAEVASSEDGGPLGRPASKAAWIRDALATQLPIRFPKIKAVLWFNWDDDDPALDWPIESSPASIEAWAESIASAYYAASDFANLNLSPIPPLTMRGFVPISPASQAIQPGETATYRFHVIDIDHLGDTVTLSVGSPSPSLTVWLAPTALDLPGQVTLTLTDTHSSGSLVPGMWYSVPITATGDGFAHATRAGLLVGGVRLYLPVILRTNP